MIENDFFAENNIIHQEKEQQTRQKSALKLNVGSINTETHSGIINDYEVHLDFCPCRDFAIRRLPCKHMYRLAHELGVFKLSGKVISDSSIKSSATIDYEKSLLKTEVNKLDETDRYLLYLVLYNYLYKGKASYVTAKTNNIDILLSKQMVRECLDLKSFTNHINKKDLVDFVRKENCAIRLTSKKIEIMKVLEKEYPDTLNKLLADFWILQPTEQYIPYLTSIYKIVVPQDKTKREGYTDYFDIGINLELKDIPHWHLYDADDFSYLENPNNICAALFKIKEIFHTISQARSALFFSMNGDHDALLGKNPELGSKNMLKAMFLQYSLFLYNICFDLSLQVLWVRLAKPCGTEWEQYNLKKCGITTLVKSINEDSEKKFIDMIEHIKNFYNHTDVKPIRDLYNRLKHRETFYVQGLGDNDKTIPICINNKNVEKFYREEMIFDDWEKKLALFHNEFIDYFDKIVEVVAPKQSNQIKLDKKFF